MLSCHWPLQMSVCLCIITACGSAMCTMCSRCTMNNTYSPADAQLGRSQHLSLSMSQPGATVNKAKLSINVHNSVTL